MKHFAKKNGQKTFKPEFMKKFKLFFKNLTPKNDWTFIETKLKYLIFHKKTISSNYNQIRNEKLTKIGKKLPKSD